MRPFLGVILCGIDVAEYSDHAHIAQCLVDRYYPGCKVGGFGVWTMEPGQIHPRHVDEMRDDWVVRLHIPLATNPGVIFTTDDGECHMEVGKAYEFNPRAPHAVENRGETVRAHLIIDVVK